MKWLIVIVALLGGGAVWYAHGRNGESETGYRFATIDRGPIAQTVSSTGKLSPVVNVQVGSQVSGQIAELLADFNTQVKKDQVIARLDAASFEAKVMEARANLSSSKANVSMQRATLAQFRADLAGARAALREAELELSRKKSLFARRVVAKSEVDKATAARDQARAVLDSATAKIANQKAQVETALAQIEEKTATLRQRELDLEHTIIRSPVDGVVISRNIDIGQTVAASLQAPVLFVIAQDLRRMQVEVSVDEADIGRIRETQNVTFTVDAYPRRNFYGSVRQIRKAPTEVSNVITYTVVVSADNPDLELLPGMTANVDVIVGERAAALRVPNAALRFRPTGTAVSRRVAPPLSDGGGRAARRAAAVARLAARIKRLGEKLALTPAQQEAVRGIYRDNGRKVRGIRRSGLPPAEQRREMQKMRSESNRRIAALLDDEQRRKFRLMQAENVGRATRRAQVWVPGEDGAPRSVAITTGISDGSTTEIVDGALKEGDRVITGTAPAAGASS